MPDFISDSEVMKWARRELRLAIRVVDDVVMIDTGDGWREMRLVDEMAALERVQERREGAILGYDMPIARFRRCIRTVASERPIGDLADDGRHRPVATSDRASARQGHEATESSKNRKRASLGLPARNGRRAT